MTTLLYDWNHGPALDVFPGPIELCDETLRDGLQSPSVKDPSLEDKKKLLSYMARLGVTIANIGLPAAGNRIFEHALALAQFHKEAQLPISMSVAARTLAKDLEPVARLQDKAQSKVEAYCFLGASPVRQYVENWGIEDLLKHLDETFLYANQHGIQVAFVTEDTTRSDPELLYRLFRFVISKGCKRLVLCDTVGHITPMGVKNLVGQVCDFLKREKFTEVELDWHGHNDRGFGLVNALEAFRWGCKRIHGTAMGIGERAGNTSMDQLLVNLKLLGVVKQDLGALSAYVELASQACEVPIPFNYPVFGMDAFRTATGVHAAAIIKALKQDEELADVVYSGVPAKWFGKKQIIEVGPMSGLSNIRYWAYERGILLSESLEKTLFEYAKTARSTLSEEELMGVIQKMESP